VLAPKLTITLVEPSATYTSCPFSNEVMAGLRSLTSRQQNYSALKSGRRVTVVPSTANGIDPVAPTVTLANGSVLPYDRLVLAPGIEFDFGAIEGHSAALAAGNFPHGWKAGSQTTKLNDLLKAMPAGGTVLISVPPAPYRCPPAPYERASLVAYLIKASNKRGKVILLDGNDSMPKQALFEEAWNSLYPGIVTRITKSNGGTVRKLDSAARTFTADAGLFKGNVINLIVPHRAGDVAVNAGLADATGFCPVDPRGF
jgi:sulfide dehydrogenase [flavocytochrome c] flavoprotein subunit